MDRPSSSALRTARGRFLALTGVGGSARLRSTPLEASTVVPNDADIAKDQQKATKMGSTQTYQHY